jgi:putative Ca2+/H+ antiporter (TMEM165/GDT1 family)
MGIAVGAGGLLTLLPVHVKDIIVALLFLGGASYLLFVPEQREEEKGEREAAGETRGGPSGRDRHRVRGGLLAEFGDLTQIQAANFTIKTHQPLEVYLAGSLALLIISFVGAYGGQFLQRVVPIKWIRFAGGLIFAGLGIYTLVRL